ncbi:metallo-beta-lactamase [Flavisolibacter tropicus]|uniref:Metallo-beta-lactamase n=2 Tax=Flavisolibacter tropicus TaxID=1492898 RepID=A0A172TR43_9BACT|nr:metallo-beta-lactamase [Flavisolibacter tropicus]
MSVYITSLNSGSNGNCYYVGNDNEAVLVDVGISCKEVETRINKLGLSLSKVKAIFVSHEHTDHVRGIPVLASKYRLPVYITTNTLRNCRFRLDKQLLNTFQANEPVSIGSLKVTAFPKFHDAVDPYSFVVANGNVRVGVFTDIGAPCENLTHYFKQCHAAFLESNYDEVLLEKGKYPYYLKNRIRSGHGHLSNTQALAFFKEHRPAYMSHLILSHLSNENNCPKLVYDLFSEHANNIEIIVASRFEATPVYTIAALEGAPVMSVINLPPEPAITQMTLF